MLKLDPKMSKSEIDQFLSGKGDYVQIDHLGRFIKEQIPMDTKKYVFLKLAVLYEKANMNLEAAKMYNNAADLSVAFSEKIKHYLKEAELYTKAGSFDRVEAAMKKAMSEANSKEREMIQSSVKMFFEQQAQLNEADSKRNQATRYYEKLLEMKISDQERRIIKEKLLELYKQLGRVREYSNLEKMYK